MGRTISIPTASGFCASSLAGFEHRFQDLMRTLGYEVVGAYAAGLTITEYNQVFVRDGEFHRPGPDLGLPYTTTGNWAVEGSKFLTAGDNVLR